MQRKEAIKEFKARKVARGVYAVRCSVTGKMWVDSSPNLDAAQNSLWFFLRHGYHRSKELQCEWNTYGPEAFQYEVLEKFDDDLSPMAVSDLLKERKGHWARQCSAEML